jgi:hypothetical protein
VHTKFWVLKLLSTSAVWTGNVMASFANMRICGNSALLEFKLLFVERSSGVPGITLQLDSLL